MPRRPHLRTATLILALTLVTTPLWATPSPLADQPGLLSTLWRSLLEAILPETQPAAGEQPEPPEDPDLGPTLDPIG